MSISDQLKKIRSNPDDSGSWFALWNQVQTKEFRKIFFRDFFLAASDILIDTLLGSSQESDNISSVCLDGIEIAEDFHLVRESAFIRLSQVHFGVKAQCGWDEAALINTPQLLSETTISGELCFDTAIILCEQAAPNYAHFQVNTLAPLFKLLSEDSSLRKLPVIIDDDLSGFRKELVDYIPEMRNLLFVGARNRLIKVNSYIRLADFASHRGCYDKQAEMLDIMWWGNNKHKISTTPIHRLYIERKSSNSGSGNRRVINTCERNIFMDMHGFKMTMLEDISVKEEVDLFRNAQIVVAVEGAALYNSIHMPIGSILIELHHKDRHDKSFAAVAAKRRLRHYRVACQTPFSDSEEREMLRKGIEPHSLPLICDFTRLDSIITALLNQVSGINSDKSLESID